MAFGFTTSHKAHFKTEEINDKRRVYIAAVRAAHALEWQFEYLGRGGFVCLTKASLNRTNNRVRVVIGEQDFSIRSESFNGELTDMGRNEKHVSAFSRGIQEQINLLEDELEIEQDFTELSANFQDEDEQWLDLDVSHKAAWWELFKPSSGYRITPILLILNILVFIAMVISGVDFMSPDSESLVKWGANYKPVTMDGGYWRLFTCCFVHIGLFHLLFNAYALMYIGVYLEPLIGSVKFSVVYVVTGIAASAASLYWNDLVISAGASGAIFGLYGVFLALLTTKLMDKSVRKPLLISIGIFVVYNLASGMKDGIDNAAHIGGLVAGFIFGYTLYLSLKRPENTGLKWSLLGVGTVFILGLSAFAISQTNTDITTYEETMQEFVRLETEALAPFNQMDQVSDEDLLQHVSDVGIPLWIACRTLIEEMDELDLPEELITQNEKLHEYCELRIRSFEVMEKAIGLGTNHFDEQLQDYNTQLEVIIEELSQ